MGLREWGWRAGAAIYWATSVRAERRARRRLSDGRLAIGVPDARMAGEDAEEIDAGLLAELGGTTVVFSGDDGGRVAVAADRVWLRPHP